MDKEIEKALENMEKRKKYAPRKLEIENNIIKKIKFM